MDLPNNDGETPLNLAATKGETEMVQSLLEGKAQSIDTPDRLGWSADGLAWWPRWCFFLRAVLKAIQLMWGNSPALRCQAGTC